MTVVLLGNSSVRGNVELGNQITGVTFPPDYPLADYLPAVIDMWPSHSDADGPEWVESEDDPLFAEIVARHFTTDTHTCAVGRPDDWELG